MNSDMFQNWEDLSNSYSSNSNVSELLLQIISKISSTCVQENGFDDMGFLDDFINDLDSKSLGIFFNRIFDDLRWSVRGVSALGDFHKPLKILCYLVNDPRGAKNLVSHEWWLPNCINLNGLDFEVSTILGLFLQISPLPDQFDHPIVKLPNVGQQCFSKNQTDTWVVSFATIQWNMARLYAGLTQVLRCLLKNSDTTRENVLEYIAQVINKNLLRARIKVDHWSCASSGILVNLSAVMLRLSEPYLDQNLTSMDEIDPGYVFNSARLNFKGLTALHASSSLQVSKKSDYSVVCECFFMTARALNLGLIKGISELKELVENISRCEYNLFSKDIQMQEGEQKIAELEDELELYTQKKLCYEALIMRGGFFLQYALSFYRVMVTWLIDLGGGLKLPLPETCPKEFAAMPEHFVDDAMELLLFVTQSSISIDKEMMEDYLNFIIMFMASPEYIRNPYLRAKMVKVLHLWMPRKSDMSSVTASLFQGEESPTLKFLVRNLLKVYIDMEFTGSENDQFYDKFDIRHKIADQLEYLWQVRFYRDEWRKIAREEEKGMYLNFLNFLINDTTYLLDESFAKIFKLEELYEAGMPNNMLQWEETIRSNMKLAHEDLNILAYTSEHITSPFLLPEMVERVASLLNYFLAKLTGPVTKIFWLKDPGKYELRPKFLLKRIARIYVNLGRGDKDNIFPSAIANDGRSYNEDLISFAAGVVQGIGANGRRIRDEFVALECKVKLAANEALEMENAFGDIPDEFIDPIQYSLMKDPVILPSSRMSVDRPVIERHLLSYPTDPFNRSDLNVEMLIPNVGLKGKIELFIRFRRELKKKKNDEERVEDAEIDHHL